MSEFDVIPAMREMLQRNKMELGLKETDALLNVLRLIEEIRGPIYLAKDECANEGSSTEWALEAVLAALERPGAQR